MGRVLFLSFAFSVIFGCAPNSVPLQSFHPIKEIDQIQVKTNLDNFLFSIENPADISEIRAYINRERNGWGGDAISLGVPVALVRLELLRRGDRMMYFGLGIDPNDTFGSCGFYTTNATHAAFTAKSADRKNCSDIINVIGWERLRQRFIEKTR